MESAVMLTVAALSGIHVGLHNCGTFGSMLAMSFEKFIADEDLCGTVKALMKPLELSDDALALDLIREMGTGLVVMELIGQGVNGVTGDYSRGAVGLWVENGEVAYPVHEVTIAGNLRDLYMRIAAIGGDQDTRSGIRCGSILVEEMTIAGA